MVASIEVQILLRIRPYVLLCLRDCRAGKRPLQPKRLLHALFAQEPCPVADLSMGLCCSQKTVEQRPGAGFGL